ncbi:uncharacterized protein LOC127096071 [Lathyrus oleraceus]|uniref:uncharacterized protein LOC127096071 n=1 Tax=Pisum sativum TaxID=3888 RepID=UPI0021D08305|nr:uncharacterized protein LOC127096071 [Pisum sativum]
MTYTELFHALIQKNLVQTRTPLAISKELPWWYKADQHCAFHQGSLGHDTENCFSLKDEVRRLMQSGILSFEDSNPNVQANPLPKHGNGTVNIFEGCPGKYRVFNVNLIRRSLVEVHVTLCELSYYEHDHSSCQVFSRDPRGCAVVKRYLHEILDQNLIQNTVVSPLVIHLEGPMPYQSDKVVHYKYNATMIEDDKEVTITAFPFVVNIANKTPVVQAGQSSIVNQNVDQDEVLKLIMKSDFNVVDQLLHTPSKIFVLSLLMSSEAHREALYKVLEKAYVEHDVTIDKFDGIVANITACNNLSFSDEELPEHGREHNLALHISMNCQEDSMSHVLVDTGSSLNDMPKSTLSKFAYQGAPMRFSGVVVKAFDGPRKTVIGEVDLPINIGLCLFQITFQVMDIHPAYSCLLGRPWIHEDGAITSTLHQKLKIVENGKLVIVGSEQAMLVSHLSSFSYIDTDEVEGTSFQVLSIDNVTVKKSGGSMSSLKDAQFVVENGQSAIWGQIVELAEKKNKASLVSSPGSTRRDLK